MARIWDNKKLSKSSACYGAQIHLNNIHVGDVWNTGEGKPDRHNIDADKIDVMEKVIQKKHGWTFQEWCHGELNKFLATFEKVAGK